MGGHAVSSLEPRTCSCSRVSVVSAPVSMSRRRSAGVLSLPPRVMAQPVLSTSGSAASAPSTPRRAATGTLLENSVVANAKRVATRLKTQSQVLQEAMRGGKLKVVPAHYDLDDGHVDFFTE